MTADTFDQDDNGYVAAPAPTPHPSRPFGLVDRDGFVWPWDGREPDGHLIAAGSRYIYSKAEFDRLTARAQALTHLPELPSLDDTVNTGDAQAVDMAEAQKALGFRPELTKRRGKSGVTAPPTGA